MPGCSTKSAAEKNVEAAEAQVEKARQEAKAAGEAMAAAAKKKMDTAEAALDQAKKDAKATLEDLQAYGYDRKSEFVSSMKAELKERQEELDTLGRSVADKAKAEFEPRMALAREKLARAQEKLAEAGDATEATWEDVKAGAKKSRDELKDAFASTRAWLADKIEP